MKHKYILVFLLLTLLTGCGESIQSKNEKLYNSYLDEIKIGEKSKIIKFGDAQPSLRVKLDTDNKNPFTVKIVPTKNSPASKMLVLIQRINKRKTFCTMDNVSGNISVNIQYVDHEPTKSTNKDCKLQKGEDYWVAVYYMSLVGEGYCPTKKCSFTAQLVK